MEPRVFVHLAKESPILTLGSYQTLILHPADQHQVTVGLCHSLLNGFYVFQLPAVFDNDIHTSEVNQNSKVVAQAAKQWAGTCSVMWSFAFVVFFHFSSFYWHGVLYWY